MIRGGGGANGARGGGGVVRGRGGQANQGSDVGYCGARAKGGVGLNPNRQRGFNWQTRIETPTLNDMKAKQGAVVSKFMTFMNRKNTIVIELYERAFYNKKPGWDTLANFVHSDLCPTDDLRQSVEDVQFHPVKMIIFIKFKTEDKRDQVVDRLQTLNGVFWTEYGVSVRGHSLDANVRVIRVLGVSPETTADDIKSTFQQVGVGEVVDLKKGLLDPRRMPGVTNGTWLVRVKILDANKHIPPYIIRREEGELWSLNFEGRKFVCWKCGSSDHIGDKCKDQERTFEEVFGDDEEVSPNSWAAVVKGNSGLGDDLRAKRDAMAKQIKDSNEVKAREKKEADEKRRLELEELENKRKDDEIARQEALAEGRNRGEQIAEDSEANDDFEDDDLFANINLNNSEGRGDKEKVVSEVDLDTPLVIRVGGEDAVVGAVGTEGGGSGPGGGSEVDLDAPIVTREGGEDAVMGAVGVEGGGSGPGGGITPSGQGGGGEENRGGGSVPAGDFVLDRIDPVLMGNLVNSQSSRESVMGGRSFTLDSSLELVFGRGATRLAIEFEGMENVQTAHNISDSSSESRSPFQGVSTPGRDGQAKKRLRGGVDTSFGDLSSISLAGELESGDDSEGDLLGESKKQKLESSDEGEGDDEEVIEEEGDIVAQQSGETVSMQVTPEVEPRLVEGSDQEPLVGPPGGSC